MVWQFVTDAGVNSSDSRQGFSQPTNGFEMVEIAGAVNRKLTALLFGRPFQILLFLWNGFEWNWPSCVGAVRNFMFDLGDRPKIKLHQAHFLQRKAESKSSEFNWELVLNIY